MNIDDSENLPYGKRFIKIKMVTPFFDPNPQKSETDNHAWRRCVMVEFPLALLKERSENASFIWIPTYKQITRIIEYLAFVEGWNSAEASRQLELKRDSIDRG
jgi:hypothetical protein